MQQFDAVGIDHAQDRGLRQEQVRPVLMRHEQAEQAGAVWQPREQGAIIAHQPAVEGARRL
jgi:hypothetical protein